MAQKQRLLSGAIDDTEKKLQQLKEANNQVKDSVKNYDEWLRAYTPIKKEIGDTKSKIAELRKVLAEKAEVGEVDTEEYKVLQSQLKESLNELKGLEAQAKKTNEEFGNPISTDQYDALQREIIETEQRLESLNQEFSSTKGIGLASANLESLGNKAKTAGQAVQPLSTAATALGTALFATVPATEELRTDLSKLDSNAREAKIGIDVAREAFKAFNVVSDETDSSVEATSNLLQAGFTESNLQKAVEGLSGAYLRFPDTLKIESLADSLQETLATGNVTGQFGELLDRLGIGAENFSEGLSKCTSDAERQNYALQTLADAGLMDTYNGWKENNQALVESKEANANMQEALADLGSVLAPIVTNVTEFASTVINGFNNANPVVQNFALILIGLVAAIGPVLSTAGSIATIMSTIGASASVAAIGTGLLSSSLLPIVGIIAGVVAVGVLLYKNWDTVKEKAGQLSKWIGEKFDAIGNGIDKAMSAAQETVDEKLSNIKRAYEENGGGIQGIAAGAMEGVKGFYTAGYTFIDKLTDGKLSGIVSSFGSKMSTARSKVSTSISNIKSDFKSGLGNAYTTVTGKLDSIKTKFTSTMDSVKEKVTSGIKKVKNAFNFSWSLPKIKLPHFKVSGGKAPWGFMGQGSLPEVSVSWYKKAMDNAYILNGASIFGSLNGKLLGGGESGSEMVVGTQHMMSMIQQATSQSNNKVVAAIDNMARNAIGIMAEYFPQFANMQMVTDTGALIGELTPGINARMGDAAELRERGN